VVFLLGRLKIPSVVGFLIAGVLMGPYGFEFIRDVHVVEILAEIGVILLMFAIGLEFSLKNLLTLRSAVFGGLLQVSLTITVVALLSYMFFQFRISTAIFGGFLISLSSTAIVMNAHIPGFMCSAFYVVCASACREWGRDREYCLYNA